MGEELESLQTDEDESRHLCQEGQHVGRNALVQGGMETPVRLR